MMRESKVIGHFAHLSNAVLCVEDACIIAGSEPALKDHLLTMTNGEESRYTLKKTRFGEILRGLRLGAAYAFDSIAYERFYTLASDEADMQGLAENMPAAMEKGFIKVQLKHGS
jgi:hypothetical protein